MAREIFADTGATLEYDEWTTAAPIRGTVAIFPGGGYEFVSTRESGPVARAFARAGWRPFVLTYSVGSNLGTTPLREAAWAVRTARAVAGVPPVAVCGFSAGGHLAASLGVHWDDAALFPAESERPAARPDALILCYPVISAGRHRHGGSFSRLGGGADAADYFSVEKHVAASTPPAFIWCTSEDELVPAENSLLFARALGAAGVPYELHVYPHGPHGLSLATAEVEQPEMGRLADPHVAAWFDQCLAWLDLPGRKGSR